MPNESRGVWGDDFGACALSSHVPSRMPRNHLAKRFQRDSLYTSEPRGSRPLSQPLRRHAHPQVQLDRVLFPASATTGPTSLSASRSTCQVSSLRISNSFSFKNHEKKITSRLFSQSPTRHRLSRTQMGTFKCRTTQKCAPRPPHASRPPSRAALPPASTACHFFF